MKSWFANRRSRLPYQKQIRLFLVPYLLGSLVLVVLPALGTVAIAFTEYSGVRPPVWSGLANFQRLFQSPYVRVSLRNSLIFLAMAVPLRLVGALAMALLLQPRRRLFGLYRAAVYLPTIIPEACAGRKCTSVLFPCPTTLLCSRIIAFSY